MLRGEADDLDLLVRVLAYDRWPTGVWAKTTEF